MVSMKSLTALCTLPLLALAAKKRATASSSTTFNLFGYGDKIGGFPLFYSNGYAYLGEPSKSNASDAAIVSFTNTDSVWTGSPNSTEFTNITSTATWSNQTFFIPGATKTDKRVGFLSSNDSSTDDLTSGFYFYGSSANYIGDNGLLETYWTALEVSTGVYSMYWGNDTSLGQVPIMLRNIAPSNPSN